MGAVRVRDAQDPSEKPEIVLQKQLAVVVVDEEEVQKPETETETMVTENNRHPLLPDQPDRPPITEDPKVLLKKPPDPRITVEIKTIITEITAKITAAITETGLNNSSPPIGADLNRHLITEGPPQPLQIITEIMVVITAVPHKIGKEHALKKYDQFALNTSCFWGSSGSNITPVVRFHEINLLLLLKQTFCKLRSNIF